MEDFATKLKLVGRCPSAVVDLVALSSAAEQDRAAQHGAMDAVAPAACYTVWDQDHMAW
jgi:hypothetical protein